jgi:Dynamin family
MTTTGSRPPAAVVGETREHAAAIARVADEREAHGLVRELSRAAAGAPATCTVAVAADRSRGKSTMLNALLGRAGLLPTEVDVTTNVHIAVGPPGPGWPPAEHARIHYVDGAREDVRVEAIDAYASERGNPANRKGVQRVEVSIEEPLLAQGFRFLDTPGVGGLISAHGRKTLEAIAAADGLVMVLEGEKPMSRPEIEFAAELAGRFSEVVFVHNRRGEGGGTAEIVRANRAALEEHAARLATSPMVILSARQAERSARERPDDPEYADELYEESAISGLVDVLEEKLLGGVLRRQCRALLVETSGALDELAAPDEEILRAASETADLSTRLDAARQAVRLLTNRPPGPRLERRGALARRQVALEFADAIELLQHRTLQRIEHEWQPELADALPDELKTAVDALWGQATNALQIRMSEGAAEVFADFVLGEVGSDLALTQPQPSAGALAPAERVPAAAPPKRQSPLAALRRLAALSVQAALYYFGVPADVVPLAIAGLAYQEERRGARLTAQTEAVAYVESRLRSARGAFDEAFEEHATYQLDRVLDRLEVRYLARVEAEEATLKGLEALEARTADAGDARRRLAALEPLRRHQAELEAAARA